MHDSWIKNLGMVNREQHCNTSNPCGILCCATLVLSLNEPATKGKLILKKKIASLLQLGDIKLKGHRHIKLKFFELVRNRENMRGLWVSLFRRFCGRSKVEWSRVRLFNSTEICEQSPYSCFNSQLLPYSYWALLTCDSQWLLHVANILRWPGVLVRNAASFKYVNTMNGSVECLTSSGLGC